MQSELDKSAQLLTPRQAAERLQISPRKLWGMTAAGQIPFLKIGRLTRYAVEDLERWIASLRRGGDAQ